MTTAATSIVQLFDLLGGTGKAARALAVGQTTASEMKRRGTIPVRYWDRLIGVEDNDGHLITLEDLHRLHREPEALAS